MTVPMIETERLTLRRFAMDDYPAFEAFFSDAEASGWCGGPLTPSAAWMRFCAAIGHWSAAGFGQWAMTLRPEGDFAGACGFARLQGWGVTELTWWVTPAHRRHGYALEASRAAIAQAYDGWGWPSVETVVHDGNAPARALIARLGGVAVERRVFPDGHERDLFRLPHPAGAHHEGTPA